MKYQVKNDYLGKVRLEDGTGSITLDETTPQPVLAKLFDTVLGKGFIEIATETPVAQSKDNGKAGQ